MYISTQSTIQLWHSAYQKTMFYISYSYHSMSHINTPRVIAVPSSQTSLKKWPSIFCYSARKQITAALRRISPSCWMFQSSLPTKLQAMQTYVTALRSVTIATSNRLINVITFTLLFSTGVSRKYVFPNL